MRVDLELKKDMECIERAYELALDALLSKFHTKVLTPWVLSKGWSFYAGMGMWSFRDSKHEYIHHDDKRIPDYIRKALQQETLYGTDFGALLPNCNEKP